MGDFNMKNIKWDQNVMVLSQYMTSQEETLSVFLNDWCLCNYMTCATRENNMLDWILTNDSELIGEISHVKNAKITDHDILICKTNIKIKKTNKFIEFNEYMTEIPKYDWRKGSDDQWTSYNDKVNDVKWNDLVNKNDE